MDFEKTRLADDYIRGLVNKWQIRLKLTHWDIRLTIKDDELSNPNAGYVDCDFEYWKADITIYRPLPNTPMAEEACINRAVIHELLHLHLAGMNAVVDTPQHVSEEQAVQVLSRIIWDAYKSNK